MNREQFNRMRMQQKLSYLWNHGEMLAERTSPGSDVSLFHVDGFFVEVFFDRDRNLLIAVEIQQNKHILYSYVKDIDLDPLIRI